VVALDHRAAFLAIASAMRETGVMRDDGVEAIGHRVVHGGERFQRRRASTPAWSPLSALCSARAAAQPGQPARHRAVPELFLTSASRVFDTAFHQTMPPHAYRHAPPHGLYTDHAVRRYGFMAAPRLRHAVRRNISDRRQPRSTSSAYTSATGRAPLPSKAAAASTPRWA
jgi:acetate kinase